MTEKPHHAGVPLGTAPGNQWRVSTTHVNLVRASTTPRPVTVNAGTGRSRLIWRGVPWSTCKNDFCRPGGWLPTSASISAPMRRPPTLLFADVNADQCVLCTLQDAIFRGYDCLLIEDCHDLTRLLFGGADL